MDNPDLVGGSLGLVVGIVDVVAAAGSLQLQAHLGRRMNRKLRDHRGMSPW
jgi:hypothetical protein